MVAANSAKLLKWNLSLLQNRHRPLKVFGRDRNHDPRLRFVKQNRNGRRVACFKIDLCAEKLFPIETTLGERDGETAFAAIVRAFQQTCANQISHSVLDLNFVRQIDTWRRAKF